MTDIYLEDGDIWISDTGRTRLTSGLLETASQRLKIKFQFFLGEWFLDTLKGVPYYRDILVKNPDLALIREILRKVALDDPDVESVPKMELSLEGRTLSVTTDIVLIDGTIATLSFPDAPSLDVVALTDLGGNVLIDNEGNILIL